MLLTNNYIAVSSQYKGEDFASVVKEAERYFQNISQQEEGSQTPVRLKTNII